MASVLSAGSKIFTGIGATLLASWTITALGFAVLDVLNANRGRIEPIASISLFTFLASRLIVLITKNNKPRSQDRTVAHLLASAEYGSRRGALVLFALCWTWLYELLMKGLLLVITTVIGGAITALVHSEEFNEGSFTEGNPDFDNAGYATPGDSTTTALSRVDEFKEQAGFDPTEMLKMIPPRFLVYVAAFVWANHLSLGLYVTGHLMKSTVRLLSSSTTSAYTLREEGDAKDKSS